MSRSSGTSTNSAAAFPKPAGVTLTAPDPQTDGLSPSRSTFSFNSTHPSVHAVDEPRDLPAISNRASTDRTGHRPSTRQRHKYFEEQFAYKDSTTSSARDRVTKDAPIIADLRTNVIIKDEYTLVTDLSHHLSQRYQRPESSIMITVNHSACLLLGGSFEPTYVLTISALPVHMQPTTNKRNAALVQNFLQESIGVQSERGIVKFLPIPEDCLAISGMTVLGDIERLERQNGEDNSALKRALTKSSKKSAIGKAKSSIQLSRSSSKAVGANTVTPPMPSPGHLDSGVEMSEEGKDSLSPLQKGEKFGKNAVKHSSSKYLKDKSGSKISTGHLAPPDDGAPRIGKRKSFISIFRR
ncbi:Tautomerase/MIF [Sporormia fimetaria CBS 119925]|uniref:L-dopachrome isomerase n=1 Tax=Sporormia fimetaria CBS 119925 TaxID=1340428 RepID=A0A6A6VJQ8_9PLEO|nr:Tautomerase/MIF [Sporormia fimetaria CBS 119925]